MRRIHRSPVDRLIAPAARKILIAVSITHRLETISPLECTGLPAPWIEAACRCSRPVTRRQACAIQGGTKVPHSRRAAVPVQGVTLIELLIVVAILSIFSAGLLFSTTQITQRAMHSERVMLLEMELARAIDTLMGDAMQASSHAVSAESIAFDGPEGTIDYRVEGGRLIRRWGAAGLPRESIIADNLSEVEFTPRNQGLTVTLRGELSLRAQITERRLSTFIAWPEEVGR